MLLSAAGTSNQNRCPYLHDRMMWPKRIFQRAGCGADGPNAFMWMPRLFLSVRMDPEQGRNLGDQGLAAAPLSSSLPWQGLGSRAQRLRQSECSGPTALLTLQGPYGFNTARRDLPSASWGPLLMTEEIHVNSSPLIRMTLHQNVTDQLFRNFK